MKRDRKKTKARGEISFQINDNYIELKTKIYNYAKCQIRQINQIECQTHSHTHTHCSQICRVFTQQTCNQSNRFFLPEQKKKVNLVIMEFFFEDTAR